MEKEFNFISVGKKMPYSEENTFLENFSSSAIRKRRAKKKNILLLKIAGIAASLILTFTIPYISYNDTNSNITIDELIATMSNEDLAILISISEEDEEEIVNTDF